MRRVLSRSPVERRLLAHAVLLHAGLVVALRLIRFGRLRRWGAAFYGRRRPFGPVEPACVLWAVKTAATIVPLGRTCLSEALAAHWLMAACGHQSTLRFGVAASAAHGIAAHAWLESPSLAPDGGGYAPLAHAWDRS